MNRLISIIIPVYNVEAYLERCLLSITNQTYRNLEIILINDGSTDQSGKICDIWASKDARIKVIHTPNQGAATARNYGLRIAGGKYIGFADADDWAEPDMFEKLADSLERYHADIAICGFEEIWPGRHIIKVSERLRCFTKEEALYELILDQSIQSYLWNKLFRRTCIPGKPFPVLKRMSDLGGVHNFFRKAERIVEINQPLYHYVRRNGSLVGQDGSLETTIDYCIAQQVRYADLAAEKPVIKKAIQKKYVSSANSVMNVFFREWKGKCGENNREYFLKIKTVIYPFYSLHLPEFRDVVFVIKGEDISDFLADPENYDYTAYKKFQQKKKIIEKLISYLHVIQPDYKDEFKL